MLYNRIVFKDTSSEKNVYFDDKKLTEISENDFCEKIKEGAVDAKIFQRIAKENGEIKFLIDAAGTDLAIENKDYLSSINHGETKATVILNDDPSYIWVKGDTKVVCYDLLDKIGKISKISGEDVLQGAEIIDEGLIDIDRSVLDLKYYCEDKGFMFGCCSAKEYGDYGHVVYESKNGVEYISEVSDNYDYDEEDDRESVLCFRDIDTKIEFSSSLQPYSVERFGNLSESEIVDEIVRLGTEIDATVSISLFRSGGASVVLSRDVDFIDGKYGVDICFNDENNSRRVIGCKDMQELKTVFGNAFMCAQVDKASVMTASEEELKSGDLSKSRETGETKDKDVEPVEIE